MSEDTPTYGYEDGNEMTVTLPAATLFSLLPYNAEQDDFDKAVDEALYQILKCNGMESLARAWWNAKYPDRA